jgi:DNA-binding transcriptional MerR regulator
MLTIGEFARLGQVSPRMLRHYDELGLLTPERRDERSGRLPVLRSGEHGLQAV